MIRVVMFDLGGTLIDDSNQPLPHVKDALEAISAFTTPDGRPLARCLVSDFTAPTAPASAAKIAKIFKEYLAILDTTGLRLFFEPVARRVTLSTHAGATKPSRKVFKTALSRLHMDVPLSKCLLVTENPDHVHAVREKLGMAALQFRSAASSKFDFDDWAAAPMLIAKLVGPQHFANVGIAVKAHLAATHGVEVQSVEPGKPGRVKVTATAWEPISVPGFKGLHDLQVGFPVNGEVQQGSRGEVKKVVLGKPSADEIAEATSFVHSLAVHGQIAGRSGRIPAAPTHAIETDAKGNRRLVRKGFSFV